jgi:hypothetical protein
MYKTKILEEMEEILGVSTWCIRRKLLQLGVTMRPRGGGKDAPYRQRRMAEKG